MTPGDLPIACTLTAEEMPKRFAEMQAVGRRALLASSLTPSEAVLRFAPGETVRARLTAIIAAEARCCAFLAMTLTERDDAVVLTITGPDGAQPVLAELVAAFTAPTAAA